MQPLSKALWQEALQHSGGGVYVCQITTYIDLSDGNVNHATHNN